MCSEQRFCDVSPHATGQSQSPRQDSPMHVPDPFPVECPGWRMTHSQSLALYHHPFSGKSWCPAWGTGPVCSQLQSNTPTPAQAAMSSAAWCWAASLSCSMVLSLQTGCVSSALGEPPPLGRVICASFLFAVVCCPTYRWQHGCRYSPPASGHKEMIVCFLKHD